MPTPFSVLVDRARAELSPRFTIGAEIGHGGQGVVYRARRTSHPDGTPAADEVALKFHRDPQQDERIAREIAVMTRVRHACLANLIEHGRVPVDQDEVRFIAWEFVEGQTLAERIAASGPLDPKTVAIIGRDVATAILQIWPEKVVHRDVKPPNVMLRRGDDGAVLIDLGCARHLDDTTLTAVGWRVGTDGYMSPEQAQGQHDLTCFSDIFSLGLTLTEALTGRHPVARQQAYIATTRILPSQLAPLAPSGLVQLLDRMLEPRPAFRPNPAALAVAFDQLALHL